MISAIGSSATAAAPQTVASDEGRLHRAALDFEGILVKQLLAPVEKGLTSAFGGSGSANQMVGSMVVESLSQAISAAGGLGFATVIEEALGRPGANSSAPTSGSVNTQNKEAK